MGRIKRLELAVAALLALLASPIPADPVAGRSAVENHEFHFTRGNYGGIDGDDWGPRWAVDFPEADEHFLVALRRLTGVDASPEHNAIPLDDPRLRDFPFLYMVEVGSLSLSDDQAEALRDYLLSGGFVMVDDFWGSWAWQNFESQMKKVFPDRGFEEIPLEHPLFHAFYDIEEIIQVPNVHQASGPTYEYDGKVPHVRGIFDERGRLMLVANWNTDLGDAWEWADNPNYPLRYSTYAFEVGINFVLYAMSH
jgi:hypothetical protein